MCPRKVLPAYPASPPKPNRNQHTFWRSPITATWVSPSLPTKHSTKCQTLFVSSYTMYRGNAGFFVRSRAGSTSPPHERRRSWVLAAEIACSLNMLDDGGKKVIENIDVKRTPGRALNLEYRLNLACNLEGQAKPKFWQHFPPILIWGRAFSTGLACMY